MENYYEICLSFQDNIIKIFNEQKLPFLMKYYLFKQIWQQIESMKREKDYQIQSQKKQIKEIKIPLTKLDDNKKQEENENKE